MSDQKVMSRRVPFSKEEEEEEKENILRRFLQERYILALMGFCCFFVFSALRVNISLAIVAMVNWTDIRQERDFDLNTTQLCHYLKTEERSNREDGPFLWNPGVQGHILACYFYGFAATQLLGARLSEIFSPKLILLVGTVVATACTLMIPVSASNGAFSLFFLQILKGCAQGVIMPAFSVLMSKWISSTERARFTSFIASGLPIGGFLTIILSGIICKIPSLGWKYVFHIFGAIGGAWCIFWYMLIHDSPLSHPRITRRELNHIMSLRSQKGPQLRIPVPYKDIVISKVVWAYIAVGFASFWCLNFYIAVVPLFIGTILKFDIKKNGIMSAIPNLVAAFFLVFTTLVSDHYQKKKKLRVTTIRKIAISIGLSGYATCMVMINYTRCNRTWSVFFLTLALGMSGFNFASTAIIPVDISPRFAGTIAGIMNTFGALSGIIISSVMGSLTRNKQTMDEWSILFYGSAVICMSAVIVFISCGSSEIQPWNNPPLIQSSEPDDVVRSESSTAKIQRESSDTKIQDEREDSKIQYQKSDAKSQDKISDTKDSPGPSSQSPIITKKEKVEVKSKSTKMEDRPWRTDSFPDLKLPLEPVVIIPWI